MASTKLIFLQVLLFRFKRFQNALKQKWRNEKTGLISPLWKPWRVIQVLLCRNLMQNTPQYDAFHSLIQVTLQHDLSHFMAPFDAHRSTFCPKTVSSQYEREEKNRLKRERRFKTLLLYSHIDEIEVTPIRRKILLETIPNAYPLQWVWVEFWQFIYSEPRVRLNFYEVKE